MMIIKVRLFSDLHFFFLLVVWLQIYILIMINNLWAVRFDEDETCLLQCNKWFWILLHCGSAAPHAMLPEGQVTLKDISNMLVSFDARASHGWKADLRSVWLMDIRIKWSSLHCETNPYLIFWSTSGDDRIDFTGIIGIHPYLNKWISQLLFW